MYVPSYFSETRHEVIHELIRAYPLGVLVSIEEGCLETNHISFYLKVSETGSAFLLGHVARLNPIWKQSRECRTALAIFQGPTSYVSPGWYPSKQEHKEVVPTWNYVAVHASGTLRFHEDAQWIRLQMELLTNQMESSQRQPWAVSDAPNNYISRRTKVIWH